MKALFNGTLPRASYVDLIVQLDLIYAAIEEVAERLRTDPVCAPFLSPHLTRKPALDADLQHLLGHGAGSTAPPRASTKRYVDRIRMSGDTWPAGFIAHHYTRYLGDLSGGPAIGRAASRAFGLTPELGAAFYHFEAIPDHKSFKETYRALLDAAPWSDLERTCFTSEVVTSYRLNSELFDELDQVYRAEQRTADASVK